MRNQKGITLIALVITIIVLLILAGVSIAMLTGQNGILTQANSAKSKTTAAEAVEKINLALNAVKAEIYKQQATTPNYKPVSGTTPNYVLASEITACLLKDNVKNETGSGKYLYTFAVDTGILTVSYYNTTDKVGDAEHPITGTIDLVKQVNTDAAYKITPAVVPAQ